MMIEAKPVTTVVAQPGEAKGVKNFKMATAAITKLLPATRKAQNNISLTAMVSA